ncbi:uncharacterized protein EAE98_001642 [Botrytis deweyae]|uniref:Uncharacterized protein n=1 Tax=Botrytis deweyae TaxID=2478750 RepID=A0ABQ7IZD3_9HELO|nr:uncharacterized protein EAE98_001642 [Botrytis deweyae]KAF7937328.1 hypothetical protein EAE98_001642 [Botrytis deweyae]
MDSGDMDRARLDDRMFPKNEAPLGSRTRDDDRQNERDPSIAKQYEDLEIQKVEFKKLQEDHKKQVHEFEEAKVELEDKLRTFKKMEGENERKLGVLRAEQYIFNTTVREFNMSVKRAREATKRFNKKSETLDGKFKAAKNREQYFLRQYRYKQRYFAEREQRIDAKLKSLGIEEKFFNPDRESSEYLESILSEMREEERDWEALQQRE